MSISNQTSSPPSISSKTSSLTYFTLLTTNLSSPNLTSFLIPDPSTNFYPVFIFSVTYGDTHLTDYGFLQHTFPSASITAFSTSGQSYSVSMASFTTLLFQQLVNYFSLVICEEQASTLDYILSTIPKIVSGALLPSTVFSQQDPVSIFKAYSWSSLPPNHAMIARSKIKDCF